MNELPFMFTAGAYIAAAIVVPFVLAAAVHHVGYRALYILLLLVSGWVLLGVMRELPIEERWHSEPVTSGQPAPPDCRHLYDVGKHCEWRACILTPCR